MKSRIISVVVSVVFFVAPIYAQFDLNRLISGGMKVVQAATVSDAQMSAYVGEYIAELDSKSNICDANSPYTQRLAQLTQNITNVDGVPLNFKVYNTPEANAFACADGSVRVYSGLMDVMSDAELLGVIGHEMGHVANKDSKRAFKQALINSAILDGLASTGGKMAALTDSQFGAITTALAQAKFSKKQENAADDFGYDFLKQNGINPVAMALSFQKLYQLEQAAGVSSQSGYINQLFSSHPDLSKRFDRMAKRAQKDGYLDKNGNVINK